MMSVMGGTLCLSCQPLGSVVRIHRPAADEIVHGSSDGSRLLDDHEMPGARDIDGQHSTCSSTLGSDAGESHGAPSVVTQSLPFILACVALRKDVPGGVEGAMRPPAASSVTLRTSDG